MTKFFKVKNMNDYAKIAAREQFSGLSKQVNGLSKSIENECKNNKLRVKIDAPCLVLPFKQGSQLDIDMSDCWVFTMGDALFQTVTDSTAAGADNKFHETFQLKV
jgi:hypothetical protein